MSPLFLIVLSGLAMSAIALVGSATLLLNPQTLEKLTLPLVALAAGSLIGGAFFHMIPGALEAGVGTLYTGVFVVVGFSVFLFLEQILNWHHCRYPSRAKKRPPIVH